MKGLLDFHPLPTSLGGEPAEPAAGPAGPASASASARPGLLARHGHASAEQQDQLFSGRDERRDAATTRRGRPTADGPREISVRRRDHQRETERTGGGRESCEF